MIACILGLILLVAAFGIVIYRIFTADENEHHRSDGGDYFGGSGNL